jgi:hypothetical protein
LALNLRAVAALPVGEYGHENTFAEFDSRILVASAKSRNR